MPCQQTRSFGHWRVPEDSPPGLPGVSQGTESHLDPHAGLPEPTTNRTFPWVLMGTESHLDPSAGLEGTFNLANANRPARTDRRAAG